MVMAEKKMTEAAVLALGEKEKITAALLIEAKRGGFVKTAKPLLDEMRSKGMLIRDGTYQETLRQARELPRE
jgi:predicted nucleic acid-binding protein